MCNKASIIPTRTKFLPQNLTEEEIHNPYLVIHDLFDFDHLPGIRELLWDSFKTMITAIILIPATSKERYPLPYMTKWRNW
jgi:hypothetical protein